MKEIKNLVDKMSELSDWIEVCEKGMNLFSIVGNNPEGVATIIHDLEGGGFFTKDNIMKLEEIRKIIHTAYKEFFSSLRDEYKKEFKDCLSSGGNL